MGALDFNLKYFDLAQNNVLEINKIVSPELELIVVIPAYKEPDIVEAISSLFPTSLEDNQYEIIVVLNHPETATKEVIEMTEISFTKIEQWKRSNKNQGQNLLVFKEKLPTKHAGVGLARKIGMDAAVNRFKQINKPHGIVMTYDGDCDSTPDHLAKVLTYFQENKNILAASIHYEHPFQNIEDKIYQQNIIDYELHLRAYIQWEKYIGLPYAFQTIGSSMAVRSAAYTRKGGMNKRKAGEDFYFLHKFTHDGTFGEIKTTTVFPSCRISDRVPFGTGRAMQEAREQGREMLTYNPSSFLLMKKLIDNLDFIYTENSIDSLELDSRLMFYLNTIHFSDHIISCFQNSASLESFKKRFFQWMDAFQMMKYLHHMRDHHFPNVIPLAAANELMVLFQKQVCITPTEALLKMRSQNG